MKEAAERLLETCGHPVQNTSSVSVETVTEIRLDFMPVEGKDCFQPQFTLMNPTSMSGSSFRYDHVNTNHPASPPPVGVLDPVFVNPNSHKTIVTVLRQIGTTAGIKTYGTGSRYWLAVYMDGLPYMLAHKVIRSVHKCVLCSESFFGNDEFVKHCIVAHNSEHRDFVLEFDWVLLRIGPRHMEMNMTKSFFELNWEVFMCSLVEMMGFKSERAQKYAKKCSDNHKSWALLEIFFDGTTDELLIPYVRKCMEKGFDASVKGFFRFLNEVKDPNYMYLAEQCFTYCQAVVNYRAGVRRNNVDLMNAARCKYSPVFHARVHPKYRFIDIADMADRLLYQSELGNFFNRCESVSVSGDPSKGEGLDFVLENFNKLSKSWITGMPDTQMWINIFRNSSKLYKLRIATFQNMGISDPSSGKSGKRPSQINEINAWRSYLRNAKYCLDPFVNRPHVSVDGNPLDSNLVKFTSLAMQKRNKFIELKFLGKPVSDDRSDNYPVFVTVAESSKYHDINNQTKSVIEQLVLAKLDCISDTSLKEIYSSEWSNEIKRSKKSDYINLYNEICTLLEQEECNLELCEEND
ncbi:uncharacterized protein LOC144360163 [Saccoglossus kowalevskii]